MHTEHAGGRTEQSVPRLLLVDPSRIMHLMLGQQLTRRGYDVLSCQSAPEALGMLATEVINLMLVEMDTPDISGLDFLLWLKVNRPELPTILLLSSISDEMRQFLRQHDVIYFDKAWQLETLMSLIEPQLRKRGLDITAQDLMLFELIQLCVLSNRRRCIRISEPVTGEQGTLWFSQNRIVHALANDQIGEAALGQMMRMARGTFQEIPWEAPGVESITRSLDALMMGIALQIDEDQHASGTPLAAVVGQNRSLLVLSWNAQQRLILDQHFRGCGFQVQGLARALEALEWLEKYPCDLLILDQQLADMGPQAFLEQVHALRPQTRVILLVEELSNQAAQLARQWGVASCYQKPVALGELEALVRYMFSPHSFSGKLWNMSLLDYLQIVSFGNNPKTLRIHDLLKETQGLLTFADGNIVHAELEHLRGEEAFHAMLGIQRGLLNESTQVIGTERSIDIPLTRLLMRAMTSLEFSGSEGADPTLPMAVTETHSGESMKSLLFEPLRFTIREAIDLLIQIATVLAQDHARGLVYGPLRPENIRILPNQSVRIDFRLDLKLENHTDSTSHSGAAVDYMSPEQIQAPNKMNSQADLFSFGAIMYELFTGQQPFSATSAGAAMLRIMGEPPEPPRSFNQNLPETLELIVLACLEKDPVNRFVSAQELANLLADCRNSLEPETLALPLRSDRLHRKLPVFQNTLRNTADIKLRNTMLLALTTRHKLLHIEDDPIRLQMMLDYIAEHGLNYDCVQTSYAAEALQLVSRQDFDFIICDYILKDGTAESILELAQGTPLVVVSSLNQPEVIIRLMKKGALDYIIKGNAQEEFRQIMALIQKKTERLKQMGRLDTLPGLQATMEMAESIAQQVESAMGSSQPLAAPSQMVPKLATELKAEPELIFQRVIGKQGHAPGEFASPRWLHYCTYRRNLLVADTQNSRIQILSLTGDVIRIVQHPELVSPCAITRGANGRIYVLDAADAKLRIFSPEGSLIQTTGGKPTFKSAFGLSLLDSQELVVTDPENHCIHLLDANGQLKHSLELEFKSPSGVVALQQQIYVLDFGLPAVFRLSQSGQQLARFGKRGTGKGDFSVPKGISVNEMGHIFVAEALSHRIQIFDSEGTWISTFGKKGAGEGEFNNPESLACRPGGVIYVLDRGNHRIQVFKYLVH